MKYILIVIGMFSPITFPNEDACDAALSAIKQELPDQKAACVPQGVAGSDMTSQYEKLISINPHWRLRLEYVADSKPEEIRTFNTKTECIFAAGATLGLNKTWLEKPRENKGLRWYRSGGKSWAMWATCEFADGAKSDKRDTIQ